MIQIDNLLKQYNGLTALNLKELTIAPGESFGLVGNNGAGKTTMFRLILDLIKADAGRVRIDGRDVAGDESWKHFTGSYLDEGFLIDFLTPEEYFDFTASLYGLSKGDLDAFYQRFGDFFNDEIKGKKKYIRDLSKGNQKKVGIAAALMPSPRLILLDEPFTNLDPSTQIRLKNILREEQQKKEVTLLISSHDLNHVTEVCHRIVVLEKGLPVHDLHTNTDTLKTLEAYFAV
jgi:ABC-2 type transport system ATP-binding protein